MALAHQDGPAVIWVGIGAAAVVVAAVAAFVVVVWRDRNAP